MDKGKRIEKERERERKRKTKRKTRREKERKRGVVASLFISSQTGARKFVAVSVSPQLFFL